MGKLSMVLGTLRRIRKSAAILLVQDVILPWYEDNSGEAVSVAQISLRDEVATKFLEAFAGVVWTHRDLDESVPENRFLVTHVIADVANGGYMLKVTFEMLDVEAGVVEAGVDKMEGELPLHEFLHTFKPVGEVTFTEYNA